MKSSAKKSSAKKRRMKLSVRKKSFIAEDLVRFMPPVSRMGGTNPVDWRWGMRVGELRPEKIAKKTF
jgi:hypothetical protein